jgi:hypothetical protein
MLEPEVLEEEGLALDEPVVDVAELVPDEPGFEWPVAAPDLPMTAPEELAPDEPVVDLADPTDDESGLTVSDPGYHEPIPATLGDRENPGDAADAPGSGNTGESGDVPDPHDAAEAVSPDDSRPDPSDEGPSDEGPSDEVRRSAVDGGPAPRIYTRTLAELYARQGFVDRAVEVFRQLRVENPDDQSLAERLGELEAQLPGGSSERLVRDDAGAADVSRAERARERDEELESLARDLAGQGRDEPDVDSPFAWAAEETENAPDPKGEGPSIGSYFDELLAWQPKGRR